MNDEKEYKDQEQLISEEIGITKVDLAIAPVPIKDVLDEIMPQGEAVKAEDFVDQPIVIHTVRFFVGQYGLAAFVVFTDVNGVLYNFVLGQKIVLPKLAAVKERLPVLATLTVHEGGQFGEYYDIE